MSIDTLFVIGVIAGFTIFGIGLFWGWTQTRDKYKPFE